MKYNNISIKDSSKSIFSRCLKILFCPILVFCFFNYGHTQVPFECNGLSYRVLAADEGTYLQKIKQDESNQTIAFDNLHFYPDHEINAIAYHPTQNVIYGIIQTEPYQLCRIDATYNLEILQTLPLSTELVYVSGDISPDEQHLVIFGFGNTNTENIVALIDVQSGEYSTEILSLQTSNENQSFIYCADIAFHPTTGKLFGFDFKNGRLVTLDITNRIIDNDTYSISAIVLGNVPSIFFNDKGDLYGIGTNLQEEDESRGYYQFDLETGQPDLLQELEIERNQDACSCPYRIKLLNEVRQRKNGPCTEMVFEISLINRTLSDQVNLTLYDPFPEGVMIESISPLNFDATITRGIGGNVLELKDLHLPIGVFTFELILSIDKNTNLGEYENQVVLSGIQNEDIEFSAVYSDDPETAVANDATKFSIHELTSTIDNEFFGICQGDEISIHAGIFGANSYEWSTGETTEKIIVDAEGLYQVTITTLCDQTVATATVTLDEMSLELGEDKILENGETILLKPTYLSHSPIASFNWETNNLASLLCPSCENLEIQPDTDTQVALSIENITGCSVKDHVGLRVVDVNIYAANIFNPNSTGLNSTFFLQGNLDFDITSFEIYDRWGNLIFLNEYLEANQPLEGWNGRFKGIDCSAGVYVWSALIRYKNGNQKLLAGDITLVR